MEQPVKILEKKIVIQLFGVGLILAPFVNTALIIYTKMQNSRVRWDQISLINTLKNSTWDTYALSLLSIVIGLIMLRGSTKAWRAVLFLIGFHTAVQILNYKTASAGNVLWWPFFLVNSTLFIFIADQLVWKIPVPAKKQTPLPASSAPSAVPSASTTSDLNAPIASAQAPTLQPSTSAAASAPVFATFPITTPPPLPKPVEPRKVIHLKTNKKIFLRHGSEKPWAEIKNMNSQGFEAYNLQSLTDQKAIEIAQRPVVLKLSNGLVLRAELKRQFNNIYYFEFCNQSEQHEDLIHSWFKKIAI